MARSVDPVVAHGRLQDDRNHAIERLARGVVHDLRNQMMVIDSCASFLAESLAAGESDDLQDVREIQQAGTKVQDLMELLTIMAGPRLDSDQSGDLNRCVSEVSEQLRHLYQGRIAVNTRLSHECCIVQLDHPHLDRVIMELATWAANAMPDGGGMSLSTQIVPNPDLDRECVRFDVDQSGLGLDPDEIGHVLEPYFTPRGHMKGKGLGLAVASAIVSAAGGTIEVRSAPEGGTSFSVHLPLKTKDEITPRANQAPINGGVVV